MKKPRSEGPANVPARMDRRGFVAKASAVLASVGVVGCKKLDAVAPEFRRGDLEVRVLGLSANDGGSVTVTSVDDRIPSFSVPLPSADAAGIAVGGALGITVGVYSLKYTPPEYHVPVDPESATRQISVLEGTPARADFTVQGLGELEVVVSGLGASATTHGLISIAEPDNTPAGTSVSMTPPSNGESSGRNSAHPVGDFRVTHTPPVGHESAEQLSTKNVSVVAGSLSRVSFIIRETGATAPVVFASDWRNAPLGHAGVSDGGKWNVTNGSNQAAQVIIASDGLDFPTDRVYRCEYIGSAYAIGRLIVNRELQVGEEIFRRIYWRYAIPSGPNAGSSNHPLESTNNPSLNTVRPHAWDMTNSVNGAPFNARWLQTYDNQPTFPDRAHSWGATFEPNRTYRIEWALRRVGVEEWKTRARTYGTNGDIVHTESDYVCQRFGHSNHSLATSGTAPNSFITSGARALSISGTSIGYQGGYNYPGEYLYWGGFAASLSNWCGEYIPGEAG